MILCVPQVLGSATSKHLRAKETSRAAVNRAKRFAVVGGRPPFQRPQMTLQLKLHIWSCSLVSAHFLSCVDDISKLSLVSACKTSGEFPTWLQLHEQGSVWVKEYQGNSCTCNIQYFKVLAIFNLQVSCRRKTWRIFRLAWRLLPMGSKRGMRMQDTC